MKSQRLKPLEKSETNGYYNYMGNNPPGFICLRWGSGPEMSSITLVLVKQSDVKSSKEEWVCQYVKEGRSRNKEMYRLERSRKF